MSKIAPKMVEEMQLPWEYGQSFHPYSMLNVEDMGTLSPVPNGWWTKLLRLERTGYWLKIEYEVCSAYELVWAYVVGFWT